MKRVNKSALLIGLGLGVLAVVSCGPSQPVNAMPPQNVVFTSSGTGSATGSFVFQNMGGCPSSHAGPCAANMSLVVNAAIGAQAGVVFVAGPSSALANITSPNLLSLLSTGAPIQFEPAAIQAANAIPSMFGQTTGNTFAFSTAYPLVVNAGNQLGAIIYTLGASGGTGMTYVWAVNDGSFQ
jgi:hypothetical protein